MKLESKILRLDDRTKAVKEALAGGSRLGLITSIDGSQLLTVLLTPKIQKVDCFETALEGTTYNSMTPVIPQAHWFERTVWDLFGLLPAGHPRLKHSHLHEPYAFMPAPLSASSEGDDSDHAYKFLEVEGEGVYEIPVGPIHAGIIEPGHFRFSCYGEIIANLEIRLGYVHRGVEKKMTEVAWKKMRFLAEAAASDMTVANAWAHAMAIESLFDVEIPRTALLLRTIALEVERVAMHISDLGGLAGDIGFLAIASSMARLRGQALRLAELVSGNRFMRAFVCPGGVTRPATNAALGELRNTLRELQEQLSPVIEFYMENQVAIDRMEGVGKVPARLAVDFGLVGVSGRACGIDYDCRTAWGSTPAGADFGITTESGGDVLARTKVRMGELKVSLRLIDDTVKELVSTDGPVLTPLPEALPVNALALGIVESHRGELIHLVKTGEQGSVKRYCIKDPSVNNWTGLAIAVRNNLVADFPLCNKSFGLSYSGHDL